MSGADDTVEQVMQRAELALFRAKSGGRNSIQTADSRQQTADSRQQTADSKNTSPASSGKNK
jgi:predicted signal transduction protein with EAL and GGDEF domain